MINVVVAHIKIYAYFATLAIIYTIINAIPAWVIANNVRTIVLVIYAIIISTYRKIHRFACLAHKTADNAWTILPVQLAGIITILMHLWFVFLVASSVASVIPL